MKKALRLLALVSVIIFAFISCDENQNLIINPETPTPTIRGTVSIPEGSGFTGSDFFIRIMEGEKAVYTGRVNADGSFSVPGLSEQVTYSILLTTEEPGDIKGTEKDISRATKTSGMGGWLSNVTASINEQAGVGSVKVKPLGTIKGVVTKDGAEDGYDTTVYIPGTSYLAMTDGQGNFSIFNVPQATYTLRYISNGYMAKMVSDVVLYSDSDTENPVTTVETQKLIKNAGNLVGNITKIGSTDHSNITVRISDGKNTYTEGTATDGTLLITGIEPGTYVATISSSGFVTQTVSNIRIEAAKDTTINPVSLTANGGDITGTVSMNDGGDKAGVIVTAASSDGKYSYTASTDANGKYTFTNAYPRTYTLTLAKTGYAIVTKTNVKVTAGQSTQVSNVSFSSDYGTVTGRVTDTKGNGIENAIVKIGDISIFTGSDGRFSKTGIGVGNYSVTVSKDEYGTKTLAQTITVVSSETTDIGIIKLASVYGSITGTVSVNDGGSTTGIDVTATASNGTKTQVKTTASGAYTISGLVPGNYTVSANADGYADASRSVAVTADSNTAVDVLALTSLIGSLKVTVGYADNASRKDGITVSVFDSEDKKVVDAITTSSLIVEFQSIPVGTGYRITAEADGYATAVRTGISVMSALETSVTVLDLTNMYGTVIGQVTDSRNNPIENAIVKVGDISIFTGTDGRFSKTGIGIGNYSVTISKDEYGTKTIAQTITVGSSETTDIGTIQLASIYGSITGTVTVNDGGTTEGIIVTATAQNGSSTQVRTVADGSYLFMNLNPGAYTVKAEADGYLPSSRSVSIAADLSVTADNLALLSETGTLMVSVGYADNGSRKDGIAVSVYNSDSLKVADATTTDSLVLEFTDIAVGTGYRVVAQADGYAESVKTDISVTSAGIKLVSVPALTNRFGSVSGRVTDTKGNAVENAIVRIGESTAFTDAEGRFAKTGLGVGNYTVTIGKTNYTTETLVQAITVESSKTTDIGTVQLASVYGSITGTVTVNDNGSAVGIDVTATATDGTKTQVKTTTGGVYTIAGLTPGSYTVSTKADGYMDASRTVAVTADSNTTADVLALTSRTGSLKVTVGYADNASKKDGITISVFDSEDKKVVDAVTTNSLTVEFLGISVETGYRITAEADGYATSVRSGISVISALETSVAIPALTNRYGTVTGRVTDNKNNPIENAIVKIGDISVFTDRQGRFSKIGIVVGNYSVTVSKDGYDTKTFAQTISIESSSVTDIGAIILSSVYGSVSGTVTVNDDGSVEGITVTATAQNGVSTQVRTLADGTYTFTNLLSGIYTVRAEADGYEPASRSVSVSADTSASVDILALLCSTGTLTVTVGYSDTDQTEGITVTVYDSSAKKLYEVMTLDSLSLSFIVPAGDGYRVTAEAVGYGTRAKSDIIVNSATETVIVMPDLSDDFGQVNGKVEDSNGNGIANAIVKLGDLIVFTDENGQFSKSGLEAGTYQVTVSKDDYFPYTLDGRITVEKAKETNLGTIRLSSLYGSISGTVSIDNGGSSTGIHVYAVSSDGGYSYSTLTTGGGAYSFAKVVSGDYTVTVKQPGFADETESINVSADNNTIVPTISLSSEFGGVIGKVALSESVDNSGVVITLTFIADTSKYFTVVSGADGTFAVTNLIQEGLYTISFSKEGYVPNTGTIVNVKLGQSLSLDEVSLRSLASKVNGKATLEGTEDFTGISVLLKASDNSVQYDATTDQHGSYVMTRVNPGEYTLTVSKAGYVSKTVSSIIVESSTEKTLDNVSLNIGTRSVSGNVTLELRTDYSGALISATNLSNPKDVYSAISNTSGDYTLAGMKPGEYVVSVSCAGYNTATLPTINITEGNETSLDSFELKIARGSISGTATLEGRGTNAGVTVELLKGTDVYASTVTDDSGAYAFNVPQGNYSGVRLTCENFKSVSIAQDIALIANNQVVIGQNADMIATHVPIVRGRLTVKNLLSLDYSGITVTFVENGMTTTTDQDGYWSFEKVPVGHYTLKFERENTNPVTMAVDIVAAAEKNVGTIELIPNAASIEGNVTLNGLTDYSGITVRATAEGMAELSTKTNAAGYFYIGNVVTTETYTVHFEKAGWVSQTREISGLEDLSVNDITDGNPVKLLDTTAPVLNSISVTVGNSELEGRKLNVYINAVEEGSGLSKVYVNTENDFTNVEPINYATPLTCYVPDAEGNYTLYVKVEDKSNNQSSVSSQAFSIADYKTVVSSVLVDNEDGVNDGIITWTKNKSPYYVTGSILVDENTTLIIEPGVNIQFSGAYSIQIEGTLKINGTENDMVYLYGVGDGENTWTGINGFNDNGSIIDYANITGMQQGLHGYLSIMDSIITAASDGFAFGVSKYDDNNPRCAFIGLIKNCDIKGGLRIENSVLLNNNIYSLTYNIWGAYYNRNIGKSHLSGNSFIGEGITIVNSQAENNQFNSMIVVLNSSVCINTSFSNCSLGISMGGTYLRCEFLGCLFETYAGYSFNPAFIRDSNIIDCGTITVTTIKTDYERIDLKGNYWGVNNTAELNTHGVNYNHTFLVDYYDDFNVTLLDVSDYSTTAYSGIGYLGDDYYQETAESTKVYEIGSTGPAGGIVFYDKGYYSEGWRYLEAAPTDLMDGNTAYIIFGFYRATDNSDYQNTGTGFGIGTGRINTQMLVEAMGDNAYTSENKNGQKASSYAAKLCHDYVLNGYDDWFLPSMDELNLMYVNLHQAGLGGFIINDIYISYWSSSEFYNGPGYTWRQCFFNGNKATSYRSDNNRVRPVRAF